MYLPLQICKNFDIENGKHPFYRIITQMQEEINQFLDFCFFGEFMNPQYKGEFSYINNFCLKYKQKIFDLYHIKQLPGESEKRIMCDIILPYLITKQWSQCKQVYTFDPELELTLTDIDEVAVPISILERLPYTCFYIEFAEQGIFSFNHQGCFVQLIKVANGYRLLFLRIGTDNLMDSGSVSFVNDDPAATFLVNRFTDMPATKQHKDWQEFGIFVLNAILYLCAENAEIAESPVTKNTYKPYTKSKNKFSEIQKWDCGIRYGESIRKEKRENRDNDTQKNNTHEKKSVPVRPHTRKAHWHHYWTGKGRQTLTLKWIAPTLVGYGEIDTVIHEVKESN